MIETNDSYIHSAKPFYLLPEAIISIITGGLIYILFRTDSLVMFGWFEQLRVSEFIYHIRDADLFPQINSFKTLINTVPGGLWTFSFTSFLLFIWNLEITNRNIIYFISVLSAAVASEILQLTGLIPGTFNYFDIISYIAGTILPLLIHLRKIKNKII
ncbi:MAG: hypothetical protein JW917_11370 [Ignavibacteria bacterium]|nr:hypothetical protein [Ignavibacteria bacterium]